MRINLCSDTVTKPSAEMLNCMMNAKVGDDVMKTDPTVIQLEQNMAKMFGCEAALFFPSGTMANQTALNIHARFGDQLICDKWAHIYNYEGGGSASISGITSSLIDGERGMFTLEQVKQKVNDINDVHLPETKLIAIENTTNKGGGACWAFSEILKIKEYCTANNFKFHLDGARLFNALVAKNESPDQYGKIFDSISVCLSKGLGAPIGSVLISDSDTIFKARRIRKMLGGGMRQVGYIAAAGLYAIENNIERLSVDHENAQTIYKALQECRFVKSIEPVETNIIIFYLNDDCHSSEFIQKLEENNILISNMGDGKLRMVTHLDISTQMIEKICKTLKTI